MPTMIRPTWSPTTSEQRKILARAERHDHNLSTVETALWEDVKTLRDLDVPDTYLCDRLVNVSRATLNRRLGARHASGANPPQPTGPHDDPAPANADGGG